MRVPGVLDDVWVVRSLAGLGCEEVICGNLQLRSIVKKYLVKARSCCPLHEALAPGA